MLQKCGGITQVDPSDPEHMERVWAAMKTVNEVENDAENHMMPIKVLAANSQIVAGKSFNFKVLFGESTCEKKTMDAADLNKDNCVLKENGKRALYKIHLWERVWLNSQDFKAKKLRDVEADEEF